MKALKKLSCVLLAVLLVLSLSVTAFAAPGDAGEDGSITITNAIPGQTYTLYRMFDFVPVEGHGTDGDAQVQGLYTIASGWEDFLGVSKPGHDYFTWLQDAGVDTNQITGTAMTSSDDSSSKIQEFARLALEYAKAHFPEATQIVAPAAAEGSTTSTVEFTDLPYGYYLVDSTTGALVSLDTAGPDVTMKEKNEIPEIDKEVEEDSTHTFGKKNHDDIGKTVNFEATVTVQTGAEKYAVHDHMDSVLDWDGKVTVKLEDGSIVDSKNYDLINYSETPDARDMDHGTACTFEVRFHDDFIKGIEAGKKIIVSYSAVISARAQINTGIINDVDLKYGDNNRTTKSETITYTYGFDLFKYIGVTGDNAATAEKNPLAGAKFALQNHESSKQYAQFFIEAAGDKDNAAVARFVKWVDTLAEANVDGFTGEVETPASGKITFKGLDADFYTLTETVAPDGYNKADPFEIEIKASDDYESSQLLVQDKEGNYNGTESGLGVLEVPNYTGLELPETGSIGTTIFYVAGGILVAAALVLLITKKRMTKEG